MVVQLITARVGWKESNTTILNDAWAAWVWLEETLVLSGEIGGAILRDVWKRLNFKKHFNLRLLKVYGHEDLRVETHEADDSQVV